MSKATQICLVTGATGYLGTQVALAYLAKGYKVRGTARSQSKIDPWMKKHAGYEKQMEWTIVQDMIKPDAFKVAIKGCTMVAHIASPFHFEIKNPEQDMLIPAIKGTECLLMAAAAEPSVKRVVITSSFSAVLDMNKFPAAGTTYSANDWNPVTYNEAMKAKSPEFIHSASKKLAEEAAWNYMKMNKVQFSLSVVCPPMIFGPPQQVVRSMKDLNTSCAAIWSMVGATQVKDPSFPVWVDVRDIANVHLLCTTEDVAKGQRYLCIAGHFHDSEIASIMRKNFPDQAHRIPNVAVTKGPAHFMTDCSKVEKELAIKWINLEKCIVDTAKVLFEMEKQFMMQ